MLIGIGQPDYYDPDNRLFYTGRAGTGIDHADLERLWRLQPLAISQMPSPPRDSRVGSPLTLSRVHWVGPNSSPKSNT
jgi:hypothetical protein